MSFNQDCIISKVCTEAELIDFVDSANEINRDFIIVVS